MPNKFLSLIRLTRINHPTGYLLVFFPACYGLALASQSLSNLKLLPIFFIGSVITRCVGCIINDIFDRDFDRHITRTKDRPLANKSIDMKSAIILLICLLFTALFILLLLSQTAIYLGLLAFLMITIYPLMKRITNFAQVFLGITFNFGALIAYASILDKISVGAILIYLACCMWTISYDTIYGFMDIQGDRKLGLKSMALFLENKNYKLWLSSFYLLFFILFIIAFYQFSNLQHKFPNHQLFLLSFSCITIAGIILFWQVKTLNIYNPQNCFVRFKSNNFIGALLALSVFISLPL